MQESVALKRYEYTKMRIDVSFHEISKMQLLKLVCIISNIKTLPLLSANKILNEKNVNFKESRWRSRRLKISVFLAPFDCFQKRKTIPKNITLKILYFLVDPEKRRLYSVINLVAFSSRFEMLSLLKFLNLTSVENDVLTIAWAKLEQPLIQFEWIFQRNLSIWCHLFIAYPIVLSSCILFWWTSFKINAISPNRN